MYNKLSHFAIHTDDIERAKKFYGEVFNWAFNGYGQEDFMQIKTNATEEGELIGAIQSRKYSPVPDKIIGLECSIAVENIDEIVEKVEANGGQVLMPKTMIPHVGWVAKFLDTEGNLICGIQYDRTAK